MSDESEQRLALEDWTAELLAELGLADVVVDIDAVLALAGRAAHAVVRPAAPLTTYLVGYAAGVAAATGSPPDSTLSTASAVALRLAAARAHD